jgi:Tfp pilus assembly protein PilN
MVSFHRSASSETETIGTEAVEVAAPALPASAAAYPRVNLMPEAVAAEARVHRAKMSLVAAAVASVAVVGGLYVMAYGSVNSAQNELDAATAQAASLNAELTKYADVPKVQAQLTSTKTQVAQALGADVRWSFLLNNLSLTMPAGASLVSFQGTIKPTVSAAGATATATPASGEQSFVSVLGHPGIGSVSYTGEALGYPQVAAFLDSQAKQNSLMDPYANSVAANTDTAGSGAGKGVTFKSVATITDKALSHRYDLKAGS